MKYKVKLRRTVVQESFVEVDADDAVSAMEKAESKYFFVTSFPNNHPDVSTNETDWVAVSVDEKKDDQ